MRQVSPTTQDQDQGNTILTKFQPPPKVIKKNQSSSVTTLFKMLKFAIGAGVLTMPHGFSQVHIIGGMITIVFGCAIQFYSWVVLIQALEENTQMNEDNKDQLGDKMGLPKIDERVTDLFNKDPPSSQLSISDEHNPSQLTILQPQLDCSIMSSLDIQSNETILERVSDMLDTAMVCDSPLSDESDDPKHIDLKHIDLKQIDIELQEIDLQANPQQVEQAKLEHIVQETKELPKKKFIILDYRNWKDQKTLQREADVELKKSAQESKVEEDKKRREARQIDYSDLTMYDMMRRDFKDNRCGLVCLQVLTLILLWGNNVTYCSFMQSVSYVLVISAQTLNQVHSIFSQDAAFKCGVTFIIFLVIFCCSFSQQMESIRSQIYLGSYLSLIILYFVVTLCLYQIRLNNQTGGDQDSIFVAAYPNALQFYTGVGYYGLPKFFGTTLYAFDINGVITEIRVEMQKQFQFTTVLLISMIIEASIYIFVGTIGYVAYGQYTDQIITTNVITTIQSIGPGFHFIFLCFQVLYSISLMITVILNNVVAFRIITEIIKKQSIMLVGPLRLSFKILIRIPFILTFVIFAAYFPAFSVIISLQGCITTIIVGFVMPYILHKKLFKDKTSKYVKYVNACVVGIGILGGVLGVIFIFVQKF